MKFEVGDKVRIKETSEYYKPGVWKFSTEIAVVKEAPTSHGNYDYSIEFNFKDLYLHSCRGFCEDSQGLWVNERDIESYEFSDGLDNWI